MFLKSLFGSGKVAPAQTDQLQVGDRSVPLLLVRHPRARRYLLRVRPNGTVQVTIPRGGSISNAWNFASRNIGWLELQLQRLARCPPNPSIWLVGTELLFRGEIIRLEPDPDGIIRLGAAALKISPPVTDLRPLIESHLRKLAAVELPPRVLELAAHHGVSISRVSVRNQKSRWGSCSRRGTVSLNWRLIQTPDFVRDYIILHELAHRRQMNHSKKFWQEVAGLCPDYLRAEDWLKQNAGLLR